MKKRYVSGAALLVALGVVAAAIIVAAAAVMVHAQGALTVPSVFLTAPPWTLKYGFGCIGFALVRRRA